MAVRDTDVLLLILAHYNRITGTSNALKYFPAHEIRMLLSIDLVDTQFAMHTITGCDSGSKFSGIQPTSH